MTLNAVQTNYPGAIPSGYPGMVASTRNRDFRSKTVEDAAGIAFGKAVFRGAGDRGCTATPAAGAFLGVVVAQHDAQPVMGATAADTIRQFQDAGVMDDGDIWVTSSVAVADGDAVYVTAGGLFTNVVGANIAIPAKFLDTIGAAGLVRIEIDPAK
jgi:hypothetical protein